MNKIVRFAIVMVLTAVMAIPSFAQVDKEKCVEEVSIYTEYFKNKNYKAAYEHWKFIFENCPKETENIYRNADKIFGYLLKRERRPLEKKKLIAIFEKAGLARITHFGEEGKNKAYLGVNIVKLDRNSYALGYKYLKEALALEGDNMQPAALLILMQTSLKMNKKNKISDDVLIENYEKSIAILDKSTKKGADVAKKGVNRYFLKWPKANAETIVKVFKPKYEANPKDEALLGKIANMLESVKGTGTEFYANIAKARFDINPNHEAAYGIYKLEKKKERFAEAAKFLMKAATTCEDKEKKANYYLELASLTMVKMKNYPKARTYALKALAETPNWGKPYILIGKLYASDYKKCGATPFEQSCVFWAVVDKFIKAKRVDPTASAEADELIKKYSEFFPVNDDIFFNGLEIGKSYTVKGWINEKTKVRAKKQ